MKIVIIFLIMFNSLAAQYHSWRQVPSPVNYSPNSLAINSQNDLFIAGEGKLFKSTNRGSSWTTLAEGQSGINFTGLHVDHLDRIFLYNVDHVAIYDADTDSFAVIKQIMGNLQGCRIYGNHILLRIDGEFTYSSNLGATWKTINGIPADVEKFLLIENRAFFHSGIVQYVYDLEEEVVIRTYNLLFDNVYTYKLFGNEIYVLFGNYTYVTENEFQTLNYFTNKECTYFEKDPEGNFIINGYGLMISRDNGFSWGSLNIPWFEELSQKKYLTQGSDKYYMLDAELFLYNGENNYFSGENFMPLAVGNKYLQKKVSYSSFGSSTSYNIKTIISETTFGGDQYFRYNDDTFWYRYDRENNILYRLNFNTQEIKIQFDFSHYPHSTQNIPVNNNLFTAQVDEDSTSFCNQKYYTKRFNGYYDSGTRWLKFIENVGQYSETQTGAWEWWEVYTVLREAIIYDEDGSYTYHSSGTKPEISNVNAEVIGDSIKISFDQNHPYSTNDKSWNKRAEVEFFYKHIQQEKESNHKFVEIISPERITISVPFDTSKNDQSVKFGYRVKLEDKNLISNSVWYPAEGYQFVVINTESDLLKSENEVQIREYSLYQNYPNPFNPETKISYSIKETGYVELIVYDVLGTEVATLVRGYKPAGVHEVSFNAANLPSGVYIYRIKAGEFNESRKMILLK